jgi:hypothetical protein
MRRAIMVGWLAVLALAAAGCGGGDGEASAGGDCAAAKSELGSTVAERDRLFVDLQLDNAARACAAELGNSGSVDACTTARADLADAASQETPPGDIDARIESAVQACAGTKITSTIPAP